MKLIFLADIDAHLDGDSRLYTVPLLLFYLVANRVRYWPEIKC